MLRPQWRILSFYLVVGCLWIFFSDLLVAQLVRDPVWILRVQSIKGWLFILITSALLFVMIRRDHNRMLAANQALVASYDQTIRGWVRVMDLRHRETRDHTRRVTLMTLALAKRAGIQDPEALKQIERGSLLHDIGKVGIPDAILIKPGKLDLQEGQQMQRHVTIGHQLISDIAFLRPCADIPHYHHEKWDGSGYPEGLQGEAIPLAARLFALVDVWDALSHPRVYKAAWSEEAVLAYLVEQSGRHFDPQLVKLFIHHYPELKAELDSALAQQAD
ncbi:HD-GYP domain-containing protein [Pseudaeromonas sp. ZJS20]|uniref:HD-GYP domain-containing protein n=1 Tax=Pseudaeromonas aegiceratis TaxID=3153928 RepID=UPI00390C9BE7